MSSLLPTWRWHGWSSSLLAAITVLSVTLAVSPVVPQALAQSRADFSYIDRGDIGTLDPNRMSWAQDIRVGNQLWEGLYTQDPVTFLPVLGAADKVDVSADKKTWTFHLRDNARWSNGDPVTSADFVFAWKRMLEEPGDYTYLIDQYVAGAKEYEDAFAKYMEERSKGNASATRPDWKQVGVETPDSSTIRITLAYPITFFPELLAFPCYFPLNERAMAKFREVDAKTERVSYNAQFATPPHLVTNGPFKLVSWQLRVGMRLEGNEHYWDKDNVKSKSVEVIVAEEPLTMLRKYEAREVDMLAEPNAEISANLRDQGRPDMRISPSFGTYFYTFNCSKQLPGGRPNPFADTRVRRALAMAINKKPIVDNITRLGEPITDTYVPSEAFPGYPRPKGLAFDVKAARKLMAEAGYPAGKNWPQISLLYNTEGDDHRKIAEYVANQWKQNLNIKVDLSGVEIKQFQQRLHNKDYDVARASWYGDYLDISTFTDKYLSWSLNNDSNWMNSEYDKLCQQALVETDPRKRSELLSKAEQILVDEVPILPLYNYVNKWAFRDNVKGVIPNPRNVIVMKNVSVQR